MSERPILFTALMVRAVLAGRKTQTRRVMKLPVDVREVKYWTTPSSRPQAGYADPGVNYWTESGNHIDPCPYGFPGDRLWVRETWRVGAWNEEEGEIAIDYRADASARREWLTIEDDDLFNRLWIESSDDARNAGMKCGDEGYKWQPGESPCRWRPSIFMPRWASRITLEIVNVRVERVRKISGFDAVAEGYAGARDDASVMHFGEGKKARHWYRELWDSINAKRGFGWDANPWVWVIEFKKLEGKQ